MNEQSMNHQWKTDRQSISTSNQWFKHVSFSSYVFPLRYVCVVYHIRINNVLKHVFN